MDQNANVPQPGQTQDPSGAAPVMPQAATDGSTSNALEVFAQNLLIERGVLDLDAELVAGMKADIMQRLEVLSTQVIVQALSDVDTAEFEKMIDNGATQQQLQAFAESKIPDLSKRLTEALLRFRTTYLGVVA
ncbi:hypothetical protein IT415_00135 [bacterium]|nr:hypothetical protein [bacterium]